MKTTIALLVAVLLLIAIPVLGSSGVEPTILVYSGIDPGFAEMLGSLIEQDDRIDSKVEVTASPDILALATAVPQTECIIVYASNVAEMEGLESALVTFFEQGGALIGLKEICYQPSAGDLATKVFPAYANASVQQFSSREKRVRNYTTDEVSEINSDLPDKFSLISMGIYFSADSADNYLKVPGNCSVLYGDMETGAPLVITYENEKGGRSVAFPGIWIISNPRVDIYYGHLVEDENFQNLFTNSVLWATKGSTRFSDTNKDLDAKLEEASNKQQRLKEEAELARKKETTSRTILLIGIWTAGLLACAFIVKKFVLAPIEMEP